MPHRHVLLKAVGGSAGWPAAHAHHCARTPAVHSMLLPCSINGWAMHILQAPGAVHGGCSVVSDAFGGVQHRCSCAAVHEGCNRVSWLCGLCVPCYRPGPSARVPLCGPARLRPHAQRARAPPGALPAHVLKPDRTLTLLNGAAPAAAVLSVSAHSYTHAPYTHQTLLDVQNPRLPRYCLHGVAAASGASQCVAYYVSFHPVCI